jgi:hypothetical protein
MNLLSFSSQIWCHLSKKPVVRALHKFHKESWILNKPQTGLSSFLSKEKSVWSNGQSKFIQIHKRCIVNLWELQDNCKPLLLLLNLARQDSAISQMNHKKRRGLLSCNKIVLCFNRQQFWKFYLCATLNKIAHCGLCHNKMSLRQRAPHDWPYWFTVITNFDLLNWKWPYTKQQFLGQW